VRLPPTHQYGVGPAVSLAFKKTCIKFETSENLIFLFDIEESKKIRKQLELLKSDVTFLISYKKSISLMQI
jgi:hypothetical protein